METNEIQHITQLVVQALQAAQKGQASTGDTAGTQGIPVGVSARHIHLTQAHVEALFGSGYALTKKKELMGGQYACNETVGVLSGKMKLFETVRVLGPVRKASQVEIAATDAMKLGIKAPVRESGNIAGSAGVTLLGPAGMVQLAQGCIVAARHIHMSPADATRFGVQDGQMVAVRFGGERSTTFEQVKIRVDKSFTLEMHLDTDEANAAGMKTGDRVALVK